MPKERKAASAQQDANPTLEEAFKPHSGAAADPKQQAKKKKEDPPKPLTPEEEQFIGKLENLWVPHAAKDLEVRLEMGKLLNTQYGDPSEAQKQKRGTYVLEMAAERLHTSTSELSRMRWFAHHVKTSDPNLKHLGARNWSEVKEKIAELNKPEEDPNQSTAKTKSMKRLRKELFDAITVLENHFQQIKDKITYGELVEFGKKVDQIVAAVDLLMEPMWQRQQRQKPSLPSLEPAPTGSGQALAS